MLLPGWKGIAQVAAMAAVIAVAGVAGYAERATMQRGLAVLPHLRVWWLLAGIGAECVSMIAFGQLQRSMLRAGGARLSLGSVLATAYRANATAVAVPVIGSGIATAQLYRDFRRAGGQPAQVSVALAVAGVVSSVAFAVVVTVGALVTGNPAAAVAAVAVAAVGVAAIAVVALALRFPAVRSRLVTRTTAVLGFSKRVIRWPRTDPAQTVGDALDTIGGLRLGWGSGVAAFAAGLVNWLTDVACLICALKAAGSGRPVDGHPHRLDGGRGRRELQPVARRPRGGGHRADRGAVRRGHSGRDRGRRRGALPDRHVQARHHRGVPCLPPRACAPGPVPELTGAAVGTADTTPRSG